MDLRRRAGEPVRHDRQRAAKRHADLGRSDSGVPDLADRRLYQVAEQGAANLGDSAPPGFPGDPFQQPHKQKAGSDEVTFALLLQQSVTDPAGPQAGHINVLWWAFVAITSAVFVAVIAVMVWALLRRHRGIDQEPLERTHIPSTA